MTGDADFLGGGHEMRKQDMLKTIQLIVYILLAALCFYLVVMDSEIYHRIAQDPAMRMVCTLLWVCLGISFLFTLLDFNFFVSFKKDYRELDYAVHSDPLSGLANRLSADTMIEKYMDKPVPADFACAMIDLANIREINETHGHMSGNSVIRDFSDILNNASQGLCYVARNGGNKFLAIFEKTNEKEITAFVQKVDALVREYNKTAGGKSIHHRIGVAFHEDPSLNIRSVPDLIALANRRIYE